MRIEVADGSVMIGDKYLLNRLNMYIQSGELVAAIGPNGAGKSTLLKTLTGEIAPAQGQVTLNSRLLRDYPLAELARFLAVLPQHTELHFPFTVEQVIGFGRIPHATGNTQDRMIAEEVMAALEITDLAARDFTTLSGGEKQRVQFARVLTQIWDNNEGGFLFLDEPTSSLDLSHQHMVLNIASQKSRQGVGVFLVVHDMNLAARYADRILLMKQGEIVQQGSPGEVLTEDALSMLFDVHIKVMDHPQGNYPLIINW
jgi:iron complex transport system ATP-binding protein